MRELPFSDIVHVVGNIGYYIGRGGSWTGKLFAATIDKEFMKIKRNAGDYERPHHSIGTDAIAALNKVITDLGIDIEIALYDDEYSIVFPGFILKDGDLVNEERGVKIVGFRLDEHHCLKATDDDAGAKKGKAGTGDPSDEPLSVFTDGGARGNPGHAGIGVVIVSGNTIISRKGKYIGKATNNVAEYTALIAGLQMAIGMDRPLACYSDSELMVKQLNGEYKVKNARLKELHGQVMDLVSNAGSIKFIHVNRDHEWIQEADAMVNSAIDEATRFHG